MHVTFFTKYLEHHKYSTDVTCLLYYTIYHLILLPSLRQNLNAFLLYYLFYKLYYSFFLLVYSYIDFFKANV